MEAKHFVGLTMSGGLARKKQSKKRGNKFVLLKRKLCVYL